MGHKMPVHNTANMVDRVSRDSREFNHVIESTRDSILARAENIEFGVHGIFKGKTDSIAKRYIADDGDGMDKHVFQHVYSGFAESATKYDFDVALDEETVTTHISLMLAIAALDDMHARYGLGGRASLASWNPLGVVTVTAREGDAWMSWMYRSLSGDLMMREWVDGSRAHVTKPYTEPDVLTKSELLEDSDFSEMLLFRSGVVSTASEASALIAAMTEDDEIPNPLAGYEWDGNVVPRWVISHYNEGVAYRLDGTMAHGTVKFLLGDTPDAHTALTGDPYYPNEADPWKYNGAPSRFFLDLTPWNVRVQVLAKYKVGAEKGYGLHDLKGVEGEWYLDQGKNYQQNPDGTFSGRTEPSGRPQHGALPQRIRPTFEKDGSVKSDPIAFKKVLDLGPRFGKAVLILRDLEARHSGDDNWITTTGGMFGIVYGNEIHGMAHAGDTNTKKYSLQNLGISTMAVKNPDRVSVFFFLPRASDTEDGIYQTHARDNLKWKGSDNLPMQGDDGINKAFRDAVAVQAPEFLELLRSSLPEDEEIEVDASKAANLFTKVAEMIKAPQKAKAEAKAAAEQAAIEAAGGSVAGEGAGKFGASGDGTRTRCTECGEFIHLATCSKKPESRHAPGRGGRGGDDKRLRPSPDGRRRGRHSKAKVEDSSSTEAEAQEEAEVETKKAKPPLNPIFVRIDKPQPDEDGSVSVPDLWAYPIRYERPMRFECPDAIHTGTIHYDFRHPAIQRIVGNCSSLGRDPEEVDIAVDNWLRNRLTEFTFSKLSMRDVKYGPAKESRSIDGIGDVLVGDVVADSADAEKISQLIWGSFVESLYMEDAAVKSFVAGRTAVRTTRAKRRSKAASTGAAA